MTRTILILAGGAGTRLWPLSTDDRPKQFLTLFGGRTLVQQTYDRLVPLVSPDRVFVSTNDRYAPLVSEQLPEIPRENILVEPSRRNTAPALAICCFEISRRIPDAVIGIFPSDHAILAANAYRDVVLNGFTFAEENDALVTIGIEPTEPNTGYGYLHLGDTLADGVVQVRRFVEKPDLERARTFVESGEYAWNGGMFLWRGEVFSSSLQQHAPEVAKLATEYTASGDPSERRAIYDAMPSISIDYAMMEKAQHVAASRGTFDWSDVGSWNAVATLNGEAGHPSQRLHDSRNVYLNTTAQRPVVVVGLDNIAIVDSPDGLLVMDLSKAEALSGVVKTLRD